MKDPNDPNTTHFKEWEKARDILKEFDDRLHDLRKFGFSFLTALLTGSTILFESWLAAGPGDEGTPLPEFVKLAILVITMGLLVVLYLNDRNYRVFQRAAATRATVLERKLNLELTEVIAQRYQNERVGVFAFLLYAAFTIGVFILGLVALSQVTNIVLLSIAFSISIAAIVLLDRSIVKFKYPYGAIDWTLDRLQLNPGDKLHITLTNLSKSEITYPKDSVLWKIAKDGEKDAVNNESIVRLDKPLTIEPNTSRIYMWDVPMEEEVTYQIYRAVFDGETRQLKKTKINNKEEQLLEVLSRNLSVGKTPGKSGKLNDEKIRT